jgi:hypothetical protein
MAWSSTTSKRPRNTYEKLSHCTRGIGMQDYPSSSLLAGHPLTTLRAWPWLVWCLEENSDCPALWGKPPSPYQKGTTHNRSCGKLSGPPTQHPQLYLATPEAGQWLGENSLRQTGQLRGLPWGWRHVALSAHLHERKVTQASISMRGPIPK